MDDEKIRKMTRENKDKSQCLEEQQGHPRVALEDLAFGLDQKTLLSACQIVKKQRYTIHGRLLGGIGTLGP